MPRIVDHDQRREELARHVWQLTRQRGLEGVTLRSLSEVSGWSSGAIRHYLPHRESILSFAATQLRGQTESRLRSVDLNGAPRENLERFLLALLPTDEESRAITEVWLAFAVAAMRGENYADSHGVLYAELRALFLQIMESFEQGGWLPDRSAQQAATELHALVDGLAVHLLMRQITLEAAEACIRAVVERMLRAPA